jgi:FixJ family two-component response regulator
VGAAFLVVGRSALGIRRLHFILSRFGAVRAAYSLDDAATALLERPWSGVVLDSPGRKHARLEMIARARALGFRRPVLVLVGAADARAADAAYRRGLDFLLKPASAESIELFARKALVESGLPRRARELIASRARRFALSPQETRLLGLHVASVGRDRWADILGVMPSTITTMVKRILRKASTARFDDLANDIRHEALREGELYLPPQLPD